MRVIQVPMQASPNLSAHGGVPHDRCNGSDRRRIQTRTGSVYWETFDDLIREGLDAHFSSGDPLAPQVIAQDDLVIGDADSPEPIEPDVWQILVVREEPEHIRLAAADVCL